MNLKVSAVLWNLRGLKMSKTTSTWIKNFQSVVDNGRMDAVVMDLPPAKNGEDSGATALEFSVMALAGCVTTIFMVVAKAMRIDKEIQSLKAEVDYNKPDDAPTVTTADILVTIGSELSEEKLTKCLNRTLDLCPVGKLFEQAGVKMDHKLVKA